MLLKVVLEFPNLHSFKCDFTAFMDMMRQLTVGCRGTA